MNEYNLLNDESTNGAQHETWQSFNSFGYQRDARTTLRKVSATAREKAEAAIRNVFDAGCAAWNRGDLDGYLASYWDSDQTRWVSSGSLTRGKKAIAAAYKARFSGTQQMGKLTVTELEIDVLTETEAIAFGRWTLMVDKETFTGFFTVQLRNIDGTWLFISDHASG